MCCSRGFGVHDGCIGPQFTFTVGIHTSIISSYLGWLLAPCSSGQRAVPALYFTRSLTEGEGTIKPGLRQAGYFGADIPSLLIKVP